MVTYTRSGLGRARAVSGGGVAAGVLFAVLTFLTLRSGDWMERMFGVSPDGGSGQSEWWLVAVTAALSVASWIVAAIGWHRSMALPTYLELSGHSSTSTPH